MAKVKAAEPESTGTNTSATEGSAPAEQEKKPASTRDSNIKYTFLKEPEAGQKFAPQAKLIVKHIQNAGADGINRKALCEALAADADFKTRQPIERIVSYYQKDLVNAGIIKQS